MLATRRARHFLGLTASNADGLLVNACLGTGLSGSLPAPREVAALDFTCPELLANAGN